MAVTGEGGRGIENWPLQRKLGLAFGMVALLLVLNSVGFFVVQSRQDEARGWTTHTYEVLGVLERVEIDAEEKAAGKSKSQDSG